MDDEEAKEVVDDKVEPLEVKITEQSLKKFATQHIKSVYDDTEDLEYENLYPTDEQIKEFEENT